MFVNFSNHPSSTWSTEQLEAAQKYGEIVDVAFPAVDPQANEMEVACQADRCVAQILAMNPQAVMCQGEFNLSFAVITRLKAAGVRVVAGCSRRDVTEHVNNGLIEKTSVFHFVQFREY